MFVTARLTIAALHRYFNAVFIHILATPSTHISMFMQLFISYNPHVWNVTNATVVVRYLTTPPCQNSTCNSSPDLVLPIRTLARSLLFRASLFLDCCPPR